MGRFIQSSRGSGLNRTLIEEEVLQRIRPGEEEIKKISDLAEKIIADINASGIATGMVVGSVARKTHIANDRDLDIFLLFPPTIPRLELEEKGLALAYQVVRQYTDKMHEKYAEHPYLNATIGEIDLDLVPCYEVRDPREIQSAVDRTPFHTRYIRSHISSLTDDVLLLKQFTKVNGVYGSDLMTEGFAGYLCELLILAFGGFIPLLMAASRWRPGIVIDIENHQAISFSDPMVVIDPVDPRRNVSASVSLTRMMEFVELARGYLAEPDIGFFEEQEPVPLNPPCFISIMEARGTTLYALVFKTPPFIEDVVVPQLKKSAISISHLLTRHEFVVTRYAWHMTPSSSMLLFELLVDTLPSLRRHNGPPITAGSNAQQFQETYLRVSEEILAGPYIEEDRYIVEIRRRFKTAEEIFHSPVLVSISLGKHIRLALEESYQVLRGEDVLIPDFTLFISQFLMRESPVTRIRRRIGNTISR